jgi:hypothetical protein
VYAPPRSVSVRILVRAGRRVRVSTTRRPHLSEDKETIEAHFSPVAFAAIRDAVREHLAALPHAIDSFLEERIRDSHHYRIVVAGATAGFAAIHGGHLRRRAQIVSG